MEEIYSWIRNIVIYMIINTIIMNLLGNKSYKKYVSIVSGMILVLIVVSPLIKLMKLDANLDYFFEANDFAVEASDFKNDLSRMEEAPVDAIFSEYLEKIRTKVKDVLSEHEVYLEDFDVTFDQDPEHATFGEILSLDIKANMTEKEDGSNSDRLRIEDIEIDKIIIDEEAKEEEQKVPSPLEIELKKQLSDFYNIEQDNINISIQGG